MCLCVLVCLSTSVWMMACVLRLEDNIRGCFLGTLYLLFETKPLSDLELHQIGHISWPVSCKEPPVPTFHLAIAGWGYSHKPLCQLLIWVLRI